MNELKERIKKYLLVKHTEAKLKECSEHISKNIPWIQRKSFSKDLKSYMQLNSYIIFDEISKGISSNISKKTIKYNIEKKLSLIQEQIEAKNTPEEILNSAIGV